MIRNILKVVHRHSGDECFPQWSWLGRHFWKVTLVAPWVASEASKVLMVRSYTSVRDAIRSTPGASPPHLGGRTGRDKCDAYFGKGQSKSDREGKAFGVKSVYTPI